MGGTLADVVQVQAYLVDKADAAGMNRVYREFFAAPYPVRATVVTGLLSTGIRLEIRATAVLEWVFGTVRWICTTRNGCPTKPPLISPASRKPVANR